MSFPERTKFWKSPVGWDELGEVEQTYSAENGGSFRVYVHTFCKSIAHVGKENGELFYYCKRCDIKLNF